jgi:hypothetical protein
MKTLIYGAGPIGQWLALRLPAEKVLLGFPMAGGGSRGDDLVFMDRERRAGPRGEIGIDTPTLDGLIHYVCRPHPAHDGQEVA